MLERSESSVHIAAPAPLVVAVIVDLESYPQWAHGVSAVAVHSVEGDGWPNRVSFTLDAGIVQGSYVLDYDWQLDYGGCGTIGWEMVQSRTLRTFSGCYHIATAEAGTSVTYRLGIAPVVPMLGVLRRKTEQLVISTALADLRDRVLEIDAHPHEGENP